MEVYYHTKLIRIVVDPVSEHNEALALVGRIYEREK